MGLSKPLEYARAHAREAASRLAERDFLPFMHLGEFDGESATRPVTRSAFERAQRVLTERVIALAGVSSETRAMLEVGCGLGGNVALVAREHALEHVVGLDIGRAQLEVARQLPPAEHGTRTSWVRGDATRLPFADAVFDIVLAIECAFHFSSRRAFAREASRTLRPGGRLVLTDLVAGRAAASDEDARLHSWLRTDLAPFPDIAGSEGDWAAIGADADLAVLSREDVSARVAPSFDLILEGKPRDPSRLSPSDDRGVAALARAVETGLVRIERWALVR